MFWGEMLLPFPTLKALPFHVPPSSCSIWHRVTKWVKQELVSLGDLPLLQHLPSSYFELIS